MNTPGSDAWLDAQLRNVPLPADLVERLSRVASADDAELDAELRSVAVPVGLVERLKKIRREPERRVIFTFTPRRMALAASLLLAVGGGAYFAYQMGASGPAASRHVAEHTPSTTVPEVNPPVESLADVPPTEISTDESDEVATPVDEGPELAAHPEPATEPVNIQPVVAPVRPSPLIANHDIYASHGDLDETPLIESLSGLKARGAAPPRAPGYDLIEQLKTGAHPFASPAASDALRVSSPPLSTGRTSYLVATRYLQEGKLPPPDEIRTEDFLSAIDYGFEPAEADTVTIRAVGGPSPFGKPGYRHLQIGAQAGPLTPPRRSASRLIVAVDTSADMRVAGRLEETRQALAALVARMGPFDRLTLIGFGADATTLVEEAGSRDEVHLVAAIDALAAHGPANLEAAFDLAVKTARAKTLEADEVGRIAIVTSGESDLNLTAVKGLKSLASRAAKAGYKLSLIDVGDDESRGKALSGVARSVKGKFGWAEGARDIQFALFEALTGQAQVVATNVALRVTFNPEVVGAYRLVGHEAVVLTGRQSEPLEVTLRQGEAATALYEIWLKPGADGEVASAEATWRRPRSRKTYSQTTPIQSADFAKSFATSAPSLQAAALARHVAESLRSQSTAVRELTRVRETALEVDPRLAEHPTFAGFLQLVDQAQKARVAGQRGR